MRPPYWCPNGCGKCVSLVLDSNVPKEIRAYRCKRCGEYFTLRRLKRYHNYGG